MLFFILFIIPFSIANPVRELNAKEALDDEVTYYNAVDFDVPATQSQLSSLYAYGYKVVLVRGYNPAGNGGFFDTSCTSTTKNANLLGMVAEVYISPNAKSSKTGALQVEETYNGLVFNGIPVKNLWLQVVDENNWGTIQESRDFIQSAITRMAQLGVRGGIYTSRADWHYITMDWTGASDLPLWYWNTSGSGMSAESPANFDDFISFAGWTKPVAKQYGQGELIGTLYPSNRDVLVIDALPPVLRQRYRNILDNHKN